MPTRSISSDSTKAEATAPVDQEPSDQGQGRDASAIPHNGSSSSKEKDASMSSSPVDHDGLLNKNSKGDNKAKKAWMESDKDEAAIPENDMRLVMPALMLVLFLAALDQTIVSTALPTIADKLNATPSQYSWVGTSYLLANTILLPLYGRTTDIVGRKVVLYPGIVIFVIGSALCGASQSMNMLIGARAIQGIGGGCILSLTQLILSDIVPLEKRGLWNGFMGSVWGLASVFGPIFGGLLTERASWRWCFFINLPTAGVAFAMLFFFLKLNPRQKLTWNELLRTFDFPGLVLIMAATAMLCVGFATASDNGWSDKTTIGLVVAGGVTFAAAIVNFLYTSRNAIIPPRMLKTRTTLFMMFCSTLQALAFLSSSFYFPIFFQAIKGASPLMSGVYLLPFSFVVAISTIIAGQLNSRFKIVRPVIWFGYGTGCLGYGLCIKYLSYRSGIGAQEIVLIVAAFGVGMSLAVPLLLIQAAMPLKEMAASTGAWLLTRSLGGTLGIAVFQAVLQAGLQSKFPSLEGYGRDFGIPQNLQEYHQIYNLPAGSERDAALTAFSDSLRLLYIVWAALLGVAFIMSFAARHYSLQRVPGGGPATTNSEKYAGDVPKQSEVSEAEKGEAAAATASRAE